MEYSSWFWGLDHPPSQEEAERVLSRFEVLDDCPDGVVCLDVNYHWNIGVLCIYVVPGRDSRAGYRLINRAVGIARDLGLRKLTALIEDGNPNLHVGAHRPNRLGWRLEGTLKDHAVLGGKLRDVFIYSREV